jgi:SAM-dependent methyltransferase
VTGRSLLLATDWAGHMLLVMHEGVSVNKANWDERADAHAASPDYDVERFYQDPEFLSKVVQFDLPRLPDLHGLDGLHLQCHIGTDTLSLARLGATMTGVDFSAPALAQAREITRRAGSAVEFIESSVDDVPAVLGGRSFDFVFTGIGAICWLPEIGRWAQIVADLLKPGGWLFMREGHPMLWTIEAAEGRLVVEYPYFEQGGPVIETGGGTYVATDTVFEQNTSYTWNHGLGEIVGALMGAGLELTMLEEHDTVPWDALPGNMLDAGNGEYRLKDRPARLPLTYTLRAQKPPRT